MITAQKAFEIAQTFRPNEVITSCEEAPDFYVFGSVMRDWDGDDTKLYCRAANTVSKSDGKIGWLTFSDYAVLSLENQLKKVNIFDYLSPSDAVLARKMLAY